VSDVTHIADIKNDNRLISPRELLENAIRSIDNGTISPDKIIIVHLRTESDESDSLYDVGYFISNMRTSEVVSLLEVMKTYMLDILGGRIY